MLYVLEHWDKCEDKTLKIEDFYGSKCNLGIDLASKIDLTSLFYIFKKEGIYYLFDKSFIPEERLKEVRSALYDECVAKGYLIATKGDAINHAFIKENVIDDSRKYKIATAMYDPWNATEFSQDLTAQRINMMEFRMVTANLTEPTKTLDALMREGKLRHNGSPLLRWCLSNVVCKEDPAGNVFPKKSHERLKIDPIVACLMALAGWTHCEEEESVYENSGIRFL